MFILFFRNMFFTISQALGNVLRVLPQCCWRRGFCVCFVWAGWLSCSEPGINEAKVRSSIQLSVNDGQGAHLSLPPAVLEIPRLSLVTKVTGLGRIFIALLEYQRKLSIMVWDSDSGTRQTCVTYLVCDLGRVPKTLQASISSLLNRLIFCLSMSYCCFLFPSGSWLLRPVTLQCCTMEWCQSMIMFSFV